MSSYLSMYIFKSSRWIFCCWKLWKASLFGRWLLLLRIIFYFTLMLLPFLALVTCLSTCHRIIKMGDPYLKIIVIAVVVWGYTMLHSILVLHLNLSFSPPFCKLNTIIPNLYPWVAAVTRPPAQTGTVRQWVQN